MTVSGGGGGVWYAEVSALNSLFELPESSLAKHITRIIPDIRARRLLTVE